MSRPTLPRSILSNSTIVPALDAEIVMVECFDPKTKARYFIERDAEDANAKQTARDIASGQIEHASKVFAFNIAEGWSRDISEDVARDVLGVTFDEYGEITGSARSYIECHLDFRTIADAEREYAA